MEIWVRHIIAESSKSLLYDLGHLEHTIIYNDPRLATSLHHLSNNPGAFCADHMLKNLGLDQGDVSRVYFMHYRAAVYSAFKGNINREHLKFKILPIEFVKQDA